MMISVENMSSHPFTEGLCVCSDYYGGGFGYGRGRIRGRGRGGRVLVRKTCISHC